MQWPAPTPRSRGEGDERGRRSRETRPCFVPCRGSYSVPPAAPRWARGPWPDAERPSEEKWPVLGAPRPAGPLGNLDSVGPAPPRPRPPSSRPSTRRPLMLSATRRVRRLCHGLVPAARMGDSASTMPRPQEALPGRIEPVAVAGKERIAQARAGRSRGARRGYECAGARRASGLRRPGVRRREEKASRLLGPEDPRGMRMRRREGCGGRE